jgi:hypothetical protein
MKIEMDSSASDDVPGVLFWDSEMTSKQWIRINNYGFIYKQSASLSEFTLPEFILRRELFDIIGVDEI